MPACGIRHAPVDVDPHLNLDLCLLLLLSLFLFLNPTWASFKGVVADARQKDYRRWALVFRSDHVPARPVALGVVTVDICHPSVGTTPLII
jgi:hypothetical protein